MISLGCHYFSLMSCSVREAALIVRTLGFECMDLGERTSDFDVMQIVKNPRSSARELSGIRRDTGVRFSDCFFMPYDESDRIVAVNDPDKRVRARYIETAERFLDFAAEAGIAGITFGPGVYHPDEPPRSSVDRSAEMLSQLVGIADEREVQVRFEPHAGSVAPTPAATLEILSLVSGITLTLDHSHFVLYGEPYETIRPLHEHASHFHARQAALGRIQCPVSEGTTDFGRVIADLRAQAYDGTICVEYIHSNWCGAEPVDCVTETVLLKRELDRALNAAGESR